MSGGHERNERLLREGIDAFNRGDRATLLAIFDSRVECHVAPGQGNSGTWIGVEGFEAMIGGWGEAFSTQESEVVSTSIPNEHHLVAEIRQRGVGAASGVPVEMTNFYLLEVRDGRAVRFHIYPDRQSAMDAVR